MDPDLCMGCGVCDERCEHTVISLARDISLPESPVLEKLIRKP